MANLVLPSAEFWAANFGAKIFEFGGQFRELESPKNWLMAEIFTFGGRKYEKSSI